MRKQKITWNIIHIFLICPNETTVPGIQKITTNFTLIELSWQQTMKK